jgi:hypothetical protein
MMGVAATVIGFGLLGVRGLGEADDSIGFLGLNFFRARRFLFNCGRFFPGFRFFTKNILGSGRARFARRSRLVLLGGTGSFRLLGRFGRGGFARAGGRRFGLWHAQIADGRFRHRLHIRAEAGTLDFLLQFFGLLFEITRTAFERDFIGGFGFGDGRFFLKDMANPFAELKIGQEQQTDEAKRQIHNCRTHRTEHPEPPIKTKQLELEQGLSDPTARTLSVQGFAQWLEDPVHHVQKAGQRKHEDQPPDAEPQSPFAQVRPEIKQTTQPERRDQKRESIRANSENEKRGICDMRTERPNPIMHRLVYRYADKREIIAVE